MSSISAYKIDVHRRLCIKKDLNELNLWTSILEDFNSELDHLNIIEKQLIKKSPVSNAIKAMRRKTILITTSIYKYEQELKTEYEYGKTEYNELRSKYHEQRRQDYLNFVNELNIFRDQIYTQIKKYWSR